jgi:predicted enzyme related to lactoylglutathione lyase
MARVTGVGGVFLQSPDPARLTAWYAEHLRVTLSDYGGVTFEWKDEVPPGTGMTIWSAFPLGSAQFRPQEGSQQRVMINYRVDDLPALLSELEAAGVWIDPKRDDGEFGRFAWIRDCDGNTVELWEPAPAEEEQKG